MILILIFSIGLFAVLDHLVTPMIRTASVKRARSVATYVISETVLDVLEDNEVGYDSIISFEKDNSGKIVAVKTNSVLINKLKAELSSEIYNRIKSINPEVLTLHLGSVLNSGLLMGKGPAVKVNITPVGAVTSDFINEFKAAGINQTNHRIMIKINIAFSVLMPFNSVNQTVETTVCAAETVLVGEIPSAYTNVQNIGDFDGLDLTGDIVDFGAHDINENEYEKNG